MVCAQNYFRNSELARIKEPGNQEGVFAYGHLP